MTDQLDQAFPESASEPRAGNRALSVMDRVREAVLDGSIGAGERLNEVQLSKTLAVSRTPVRAALQALAGEGLLDYAPNRGFTVREFPLPAIVDAYDIRASLEGVAVRFVAERGLGAQEREIIERSLAAGDKLLERLRRQSIGKDLDGGVGIYFVYLARGHLHFAEAEIFHARPYAIDVRKRQAVKIGKPDMASPAL